MNYKEVIESRYNRQNWQHLLHDIFGSKIKFWNTPSVVTTSSPFAKQALWLGTITLSDEQTIAVYEVELAESVDIERNRRGIRDMLLTAWRNNGNAGAFMFCYRKNESVLRFSYVSEAWKFADDGSYQKESTDTRRFTYLLGEGHRSRTAIQQFEKLRDSQLSLKDLTKAFSVDAVSDMFFDGYKKQYENIIFYITGKRMVKVANKWEECLEGQPCQYIMRQFSHFPNPEKSIRDYVKKLMGRLVFLQFLQKKGWLGVGVHDEWGNGDPEFIQNLFASCNDKDHFIDKVLEPLFNDLNTEEGKKLPQYRTPYLNGGLFEREAADETDFPLPTQYMQSLLDFFASYNFTIDENDPDDAEVGVDPEMLGRIFENLLEDNKDKGAFYTPKEIVSYMCRESLIAYLQTSIQDEATKEAIRLFVTTHQIQEHLPENIDQLLKDVKICDPAIGSGAFPMGLLKELFLCRTALEGISQHQAAEIKKHIIQQNVYGVDIERGAVDIARLRFWLSLIVDEETPQALPNLDFKIMQGNSLLEQYKGVDLSTMTEKKADNTGMLTFFDDMIDVYRKELRDMLSQYFDCTDHKEKENLRVYIIDNVKQQLREQHINVDFGDLDLSGNDQFFLWHTWFYDVFSKGGFDIVIGNPPYVARLNDEYKESLGNIYPEAKKKIFDLFNFFMVFSLRILSPDSGCSTMIVPPTWLNNKNSNKLRKAMAIRGLSQVDYLDENVFANAIVYSCIYFTNHSKNDEIRCNLTKIINGKIESEHRNNVPISTVKKEGDYIPLDKSKGLVERIKNTIHVILLGEISDIVFGIQDRKSANDPSYIHAENPGHYKRVLNGKHIGQYYIQDSGLFIDYGPWLWNPRKKEVFECPEKILVRQVGKFPICAYDNEQYYTLNTIYNIIVKDKSFDTKYVLALLNSKLMQNIWKEIYPEQKDVFPRLKKEQLVEIPIPIVSFEQQKQITEIVDQILVEKRKNPNADTSESEREIDRLVYKLYNLTDEEIGVIERR